MKVKEIDCAYVGQHDLVALYLAARLPEGEAERFEAHYFGCENCWSEVRQASEVRTALGEPILATASGAPPEHKADLWTPLAAAAAVAVMVVGLRQLARQPESAPPETVWRGGSEASLSLQVSADAKGRVSLEWSTSLDAQIYVAEIFTSDGVSVWRRETSETNASLDATKLASRRPGISFVAKVEALDVTHQVVARSDMKPLPGP